MSTWVYLCLLIEPFACGRFEGTAKIGDGEGKMSGADRFDSGPVMHLLQKFLTGKTFAPIVTREFRPPKPDPAGILHIAEAWGLGERREGLVMVSNFPARFGYVRICGDGFM